jgi:hypothetical protein
MRSQSLQMGTQRAIDTMGWVHAKIDQLRIRSLPASKRDQLAGACWHIALEHAMGVTLLVEQHLDGSALAMMRLLFESWIRGVWLKRAATDAQLDAAGRDVFPSFAKIVEDIEKKEAFGGGPILSGIKQRTWSRLCSYTHTGYQQIGARLTSEGPAYGYTDAEILDALRWAESIGLMVAMLLAGLADNNEVLSELAERLHGEDSGAAEADRVDGPHGTATRRNPDATTTDRGFIKVDVSD